MDSTRSISGKPCCWWWLLDVRMCEEMSAMFALDSACSTHGSIPRPVTMRWERCAAWLNALKEAEPETRANSDSPCDSRKVSYKVASDVPVGTGDQ